LQSVEDSLRGAQEQQLKFVRQQVDKRASRNKEGFDSPATLGIQFSQFSNAPNIINIENGKVLNKMPMNLTERRTDLQNFRGDPFKE
jgi:hypothetical protein